MKGKDTFTSDQFAFIRTTLVELRKSDRKKQVSIRGLLLRKGIKFYISDYLPRYKTLVTNCQRKEGMKASHFDELLKAKIIRIEV